MAFKRKTHRRRRASRPAATAPRRRRRRASVGSTVVVGRRRRRSTRSVARTRHHSRRRSHKPGFLGATKWQSRGLQILEMAVGVGIGAAGTHMILRPLEQKLVAHYPMATKFMGLMEVALGGGIALMAKNNFFKSIGIGVLAGGVHVVMKQLPIGMHSPAEHGVGDYQEVRIPYNSQVAGLISDDRRGVRTPVVAGSIIRNHDGNVNTPWVAGMATLNNTPVVSMGDYTDDDQILYPKGINIPMLVRA